MRIGFWQVFQRVGPRHVTPCVTLEADGLLLRPGRPVSSSEPDHGLDLRPMLDHDLELAGSGDMLTLVGYYRQQLPELPSFEDKPPRQGPPNPS